MRYKVSTILSSFKKERDNHRWLSASELHFRRDFNKSLAIIHASWTNCYTAYIVILVLVTTGSIYVQILIQDLVFYVFLFKHGGTFEMNVQISKHFCILKSQVIWMWNKM